VIRVCQVFGRALVRIKVEKCFVKLWVMLYENRICIRTHWQLEVILFSRSALLSKSAKSMFVTRLLNAEKCIYNVDESVLALYCHFTSCIAHHFHWSPYSLLPISCAQHFQYSPFPLLAIFIAHHFEWSWSFFEGIRCTVLFFWLF